MESEAIVVPGVCRGMIYMPSRDQAGTLAVSGVLDARSQEVVRAEYEAQPDDRKAEL